MHLITMEEKNEKKALMDLKYTLHFNFWSLACCFLTSCKESFHIFIVFSFDIYMFSKIIYLLFVRKQLWKNFSRNGKIWIHESSLFQNFRSFGESSEIFNKFLKKVFTEIRNNRRLLLTKWMPQKYKWIELSCC